MTILAFLLLFALFLVFIYVSTLNPQLVTVFFSPGESITMPVATIVVGFIMVGIFLGFVVYLFGMMRQVVKNWKIDRVERRNREVAATYREGVSRLLSGDVKKARILLQRVLDRDPTRIESYLAMANVLLQDGEPQEAVILLGRARNVDPRSLEVLFKLASVYEELQRYSDAIQTYQAILSSEENNRKALRALRDLYIRDGEWKEAMALQKRVLKASADSKRLPDEKQKMLSLRYEVACLGMTDRKTLEAAKNELKEIVKEAPAFIPAHVSLGDAYRQLGRPGDASAIWEEGYRALGRGIFLARLEDLYLGAADPATLLNFYRAIVQEQGDDLMLRFFFGKLCLRLEMIEDALDQLYVVESAGVDSPQLHLLLAEAHNRRGRIDAAINQYKKALGVTTRLKVGYACDACGEESDEWFSRCASCGTWGSYSVIGRQSLRRAMATTSQLRPIHHGEREAWTQE